jgi:hypothetical protein
MTATVPGVSCEVRLSGHLTSPHWRDLSCRRDTKSHPRLRRSQRSNPQVDNLAVANVDIHFRQFWTQACEVTHVAGASDNGNTLKDAVGDNSGVPAAEVPCQSAARAGGKVADCFDFGDATAFVDTATGISGPRRLPGNQFGGRMGK